MSIQTKEPEFSRLMAKVVNASAYRRLSMADQERLRKASEQADKLSDLDKWSADMVRGMLGGGEKLKEVFETLKAFKGHEGRPGSVGGSLPQGQTHGAIAQPGGAPPPIGSSAGSGVKAPPVSGSALKTPISGSTSAPGKVTSTSVPTTSGGSVKVTGLDVGKLLTKPAQVIGPNGQPMNINSFGAGSKEQMLDIAKALATHTSITFSVVESTDNSQLHHLIREADLKATNAELGGGGVVSYLKARRQRAVAEAVGGKKVRRISATYVGKEDALGQLFGFIKGKAFEDHEGRLGKVGGSLPKGQHHGEKPVKAPTTPSVVVDTSNSHVTTVRPSASGGAELSKAKYPSLEPGDQADPDVQSKFDGLLVHNIKLPPLGRKDKQENDDARTNNIIAVGLAKSAGLPEKDVAEVVNWWHNSGRPSFEALDVQQAAEDEFGSKLSRFQKGYLKYAVPKPERVELDRKVMRVMYEDTQKKLADAGIKEVTLYRGVFTTKKSWQEGQPIPGYKGNALESWTVDMKVAEDFANSAFEDYPSHHGYILQVKVPAARILCAAGNGFGDVGSGEVIVLGNVPGAKDTARMLTHYDKNS